MFVSTNSNRINVGSQRKSAGDGSAFPDGYPMSSMDPQGKGSGDIGAPAEAAIYLCYDKI